MSRPLRLEFPHALYHVTSRGDRREAIYEDDEDRAAWLDVFDQVCSRFNWRCHAWCLMGNHYHVLVETPEANLSAGMRQLNGVYTQRFNHRHGKVGHVFQGRFKAVLVERESHLLELARYVVLNPVRAGMVADAAEWRWSSHRSVLGTEPSPDWLQTDWLLSQFGPTRGEALVRYVDFVRAGIGLPSVWDSLRGQVFIGSDDFVQRMQALIDQGPTLRDIPHLQRRPTAALPSRELRPGERETSAVRDRQIAQAFLAGGQSMRAVAEHLGVHVSTVSRAVARSEMSSLGDPLPPMA
jgi:putative transposase